MERIQLQFWPWKSQRFCEFIDDPKTLRSKLATTSKLVYIITFLLSPLFLFVNIFLTTLPRLFLRKVLVRPDLVAYSTGVFACQQAANWQGLFKGMGSWCRVFSLEKIRKKDGSPTQLLQPCQLTSTCPTYSTAQSFVKKMLWNLKCIWSYLIPISGVGKFPVGGLCFERKKRCPSDPFNNSFFAY